MPNWCNNRTNITGTEEQITTILRAATVTDEHGNQEIRLASLIPMPDILDGTISPTPTGEYDGGYGDYDTDRVDELRTKHNDAVALAARAHAETGYHNWWDWQLANWGIKWGDCDTVIHDELFTNEDQNMVNVTLVYQTPWGPFANTFFEKISEMFDVTITNVYDEPGMCFAGGSVHHAGKTTSDIQTEIPVPESPEGDDPDWDAYYEKADQMRESTMDYIESLI